MQVICTLLMASFKTVKWSSVADDYRITACFGFIKKFAMKYKHLTEKNPRELEEMHAAGLLTAESENTPGQKSAQNRSSLDYIVPTGIFHKWFQFFFGYMYFKTYLAIPRDEKFCNPVLLTISQVLKALTTFSYNYKRCRGIFFHFGSCFFHLRKRMLQLY